MGPVERAAAAAEDELLFTADLAMVLFERGPDATLIVGQDGRIARANQQAELLTMWPRSALRGMPVDDLLPDDLRPLHADHRTSYWTDPKIRPMGAGLDLRLRQRHGADVPVDINLAPVVLPQGMYVIAAIRRRSAPR